MLSLTSIILGFHLLQGQVVTPVLEKYLIAQVQAQTGLKLSLGGISGSLVSDIKIKDIRTVGRTQAGLISSLTADEVMVTYQAAALASGFPAFLHSLRIRATRPRLTLDLDTPAKPASSPAPALAWLPPMEATDGVVWLRRKNLQAQASFSATLSDGNIRVKQLQARMPRNLLQAKDISLPLSLFFGQALGPKQQLRATFSAEAGDIPSILKLAGMTKALPGLAPPAHALHLQGEIRDQEILLSDSTLKFDAGTISLSRATIPLLGQGRLLVDLPLEVEVEFHIRELAALASFLDLPAVQGTAAGHIHLRGPWENPIGDFDLLGEKLSFREWACSRVVLRGRAGTGAGSGLVAEARLENGRLGNTAIQAMQLDLQNSGKQLFIRRAMIQTSEGAADASGQLGWSPTHGLTHLHLDTLRLSRAQAWLALTQPVDIARIQNGDYQVGDLNLQGNMGVMHLAGKLSPRRASDLHLRITGLDSRPWLAGFMSRGLPETAAGNSGGLAGRFYFAHADLEVALKGSLARPEFVAQGRMAEIGRENGLATLSSEFDLAYNRGRINIRRLHISSEHKPWFDLSGTIPTGPGRLSLAGRIQVPDLSLLSMVLPQPEPLAGKLEGEWSLAGTWAKPIGSLSLIADGIRAPAAWGTFPGPIAARLKLDVREATATLRELGIQMPGTTFSAAGVWTMIPWVNLVAHGAKHDFGRLDLQSALSMADLKPLAKVLGMQRLAGRMEMKMAITGPATDPAFAGNLQLDQGEVRLGSDVPAFQNLRGHALAQGRQVSIALLEGELGGSKFSLSGDFHWQPRLQPEMNLKLQGKNLLLARSQNYLVRGNTEISAQGPLNALQFTGKVDITEGGYYQAFDFFSLLPETGRPPLPKGFTLFSWPRPPLSTSRFHIQVSSLNPLRIKNNLVTGALRPELLLVGSGVTPVLQGEVYLDAARVALPIGWLTIKSGVLHFPVLDPEHPTLDLQGEAAIKGYVISVQVQGPIDAPNVTLTSIPSLPREDLLLLLASGKTPEQSLGALTQRQNILNLAVYLGKGVITEWFSGNPEAGNETILDRFELEMSSGQTRNSGNAFAAAYRLVDNLFQKDNHLSITSEKDEFDRYHMGVKLDFNFQ